jgi:hypothetical protein
MLLLGLFVLLGLLNLLFFRLIDLLLSGNALLGCNSKKNVRPMGRNIGPS